MINEIIDQIKPCLTWLHQHPNWLAVAVFFISFLECLALVGLIVPGAVLMTAVGALVGTHVVSPQMVFIPAMFGALVGDVVSFAIGHHYREHLRDLWPFKFYPRLLQQGENFFYRHGGKGVFVGRFIGPIRPMLPIIAGMLNMSPVRFFVADGLSAIFWAPLYALPGIILGAATTELAPDIAIHLTLYVILILLGFWCVSWLIKRFIQWIFATFHRILDKIWAVIKHKPFLHPLHVALQDPLHPESHAQLTLGMYLVLMVGLLGYLSLSVFTHGVLTNWNTPIWYFMRSLYHPIAHHIFLVITLFSEPAVQLCVFGIMLVAFLALRAYRTALHWFFLGLLCIGGTEFFKHFFHVLRPWGLFVTPTGYSFPSGHTTFTTVFCVFTTILISREITHKTYREISYIMTGFLVLIVGFSRLYLGAHWLTDVIGGILLALSIIMLVTLSYRRKTTPKLNPTILTIVYLLAWIITGAIYTMLHYEKNDYNYTAFTPSKILKINEWWNQNGLGGSHFRLSRLGKPIQLLNIEWAGNLTVIEKTLQSKGWQLSPNTTFGTLINRMNTSTKNPKLPVVPPLYLNKHPALIMTKSLENPDNKKLLIITLWDSMARFSDTNAPLWIGNISYYHIWDTSYSSLHPNQKTFPSHSATSMLKMEISNGTAQNQNYSVKEINQIMLIKDSQEK
jgi:membrane protein DedA with SNARE-associated domain/membrane-associated phospholipid phosphatase